MIDEILSFWPPPAREILDAGNWSRAAGTAKRRDVAEKRGRNCDVPIKEGGEREDLAWFVVIIRKNGRDRLARKPEARP